MKLLLLPGLDGTGKLFDKVLAALPPDLPGVALGYPSSLGEFDGYVRLVIDNIANTGEDLVLVAESFSGPIAVEVLRNPPVNLKAVVLVATFVQSPSPSLLALAVQLPGSLMHAFAALALDWFCLNGNEDADAARRVKDVVESLSPELIRARLKVLQSLPADLPAVLAAARLPVLFIKPQHDRLVLNRYFAAIEQRISAASTVGIDGPHFLLQCCPRQCAGVIAEFIRHRV